MYTTLRNVHIFSLYNSYVSSRPELMSALVKGRQVAGYDMT